MEIGKMSDFKTAVCVGSFHAIPARVVSQGISSAIKAIHFNSARLFKCRVVWISKKVEQIGDSCFQWFSSLEMVVFENESRLKQIGKEVFASSGLRWITFPQSVRVLGPLCCYGCLSLESISFESRSQLERIDKDAFARSSLKSIIIPKSTNFVASSAFVETHLELFAIESGSPHFSFRDNFLEKASDDLLIRYNGSSSEVTIKHSIMTIGADCFANCELLQVVYFELSSRLEQIEKNAFGFSTLKSILIPQSVRIFSSQCFYGCISLLDLPFEDNSQLNRIEKEAFARSGLKSILLPNTVTFVDGSAFVDTSLVSVAVGIGSSQLIFRNNFLENILYGILIRYFGASSSVQISHLITCIGKSCFSGIESVKELVFESDSMLIVIDRGACMSTSLKQILIPKSVLKIEKWCFNDCQELTQVPFQSESQLQELGDWAFANCVIERIILPQSVKTIGRYCFASCMSLIDVIIKSPSQLEIINSHAFAVTSLGTIHLPKSLQVIGYGAFLDCIKLTEVTVEPESNLQRIEEDAFKLTRVTSIAILLEDSDHSFINNSGCKSVMLEPG
jgi:hypothetical protein